MIIITLRNQGCSMAIKAAINGTGRIGMIVAKIIVERDDIESVTSNVKL
jgi:glyceraldehyde-3-phosphate dehydrogenase/erythrose-4-phosphate dehydrogenase